MANEKMSVEETMAVLQTPTGHLEHSHFLGQMTKCFPQASIYIKQKKHCSPKVKNIWKLFFNLVQHTKQKWKSISGGYLFLKYH